MRLLLGAMLLAAMAVGPPALAITINDATGEVVVPGGPFPHLDISSVQVTNNATDISFKINLMGDPVATDWGKYMVGIDSVAGGDTVGNGWGRPISMSSGMDYWLGSWVDSGNGLEVRNWDGAAWQLYAASYNAAPPLAVPTKDSSSLTLTVPLTYLGLSAGDVFLFDVYSSGGGGGDSATDALGNPNPSITEWAGPYDTGSNIVTYRVVVPEPATLTMVGLLGLALVGVARRRK